MSDESAAHRPVEMLPLLRPRDERKATQLQVGLPRKGIEGGRALRVLTHNLNHSAMHFTVITQHPILTNVPSAYLDIVTHVTQVLTQPCLTFTREKMAQAYDFALDKIGMEIMSYQVNQSILAIKC